jgi:hypothetical protein
MLQDKYGGIRLNERIDTDDDDGVEWMGDNLNVGYDDEEQNEEYTEEDMDEFFMLNGKKIDIADGLSKEDLKFLEQLKLHQR